MSSSRYIHTHTHQVPIYPIPPIERSESTHLVHHGADARGVLVQNHPRDDFLVGEVGLFCVLLCFVLFAL